MNRFDRVADRYDAWYETPCGHFADQMQKELVWEVAPLSPEAAVLDLGCGTGNYSIELAKRGCVVSGIDSSPGMLAQGRCKAEALGLSVRWLHSDFNALPFAAESFDAVLAVTALEFAPDPQNVLLEAMRVLKPGGSLIAGVLAKNSPWGRMYEEKARHDPASVFAGSHLFTEAEFSALLPCCREIRRGLFFPPCAEEFDAAKAAELEKGGRQGQRMIRQGDLEPGFFVARWDKPVAVGAQVTFRLAIQTHRETISGQELQRLLRVLDSYSLEYTLKGLTVVIRSSPAAVWPALWAYGDQAIGRGVTFCLEASGDERAEKLIEDPLLHK
ncbi:MAG: methylase involved in ubiquinone/menaquinone biosynthesis [Firmicutes bacterium]|nr:methylase involved in ubiquinone/menaquinone biosynthesis [Bacillota bacterium]